MKNLKFNDIINLKEDINMEEKNPKIMYEVLDHTGDLKIKVYGNSYKTIFENAISAMANLIVKTSNLIPDKIIDIKIERNNYYDLLVSLLSDIIYYLETQNILYFISDLEIKNMHITGKLYGAELPENVEYEYVIKDPTYYDLEICPEKNYATIVFDI